MSLRHLFAALGLVALLVVGTVRAADEPVKSGPQVNEELAGPFHPLNVTGESAGKKACLYCKNGVNPVAMVFARDLTPEVSKLIKKIDACTAKNSGCDMGSFVVFLTDDEKLADKLKSFDEEAKLKKVVLSIDNPAGPKGYNVNKDADVTVVLYTDHVVKANHAFRKGQLKDKDIDTILGDVSKILPKK